MPLGNNAAFFQVQGAFGPDKRDRCASGDVAGFADRRFYAQLQRVRCGDLDLRFPAAGTEHADVFDGAQFQSHDGHTLFCSKLTSHKIFFLMQSVSCAEQFFHVFLCQMDVTGGYADGNHKTVPRILLFIHSLQSKPCDRFNRALIQSKYLPTVQKNRTLN